MTGINRRDFIKAAGGFISASVLGPSLLGCAEAEQKKPFNILFLMTDQHNQSVMSCSGNPLVKTPNLDKLASQGARFTNAVCATPYCSPTRASLITGLWPHSHGIIQNVNAKNEGFKGDETATEQILFDNGYHTFQMGKWHLGDICKFNCYSKEPEEFAGLMRKDYTRTLARDKYSKPREGEVQMGDMCAIPDMAEFTETWGKRTDRSKENVSKIGRDLCPPEETFEAKLADRCIDLIKKHKNENFMITCSISPPHAPWVVPDPYYSMYDPDKLPIPKSWTDHPSAYQGSQAANLGKGMGEKLVREWLRCYYGLVTMVDDQFGRILDALRKEGLDDNTLVVYLSDHGDMQVAHGMVGKSVGAFYDEIVRVPLMMRYPKSIKPGTVIKSHANSVDIMPTLLDFAGMPIPKTVQGRSLKKIVEGKIPDGGKSGFCERGGSTKNFGRMIRTSEWKYAVYGDGRKELFDLKKDPIEVNNLANDTAYANTIKDLHAQIRRHMEETDDPALQVLPSA